jgi:hypothetical protein
LFVDDRNVAAGDLLAALSVVLCLWELAFDILELVKDA